MAVVVAQHKNAQSGKQPYSTEMFPHSECQFAVRAKGKCVPTATRSKAESALGQYVDWRLSGPVCAVRCIRLTGGGNWEGYMAFRSETYDWEGWLERCSSVGKTGVCGGKQEQVFANDAGEQ